MSAEAHFLIIFSDTDLKISFERSPRGSGARIVTRNTYPKLSQIVQSNFELGRVKQLNRASDCGITDIYKTD